MDLDRIQAQFDHLAETYFDGFEHDLGERELGYALSFDHDLDMFAASIGLAKTSVAAILQDDGNVAFYRVFSTKSKGINRSRIGHGRIRYREGAVRAAAVALESM